MSWLIHELHLSSLDGIEFPESLDMNAEYTISASFRPTRVEVEREPGVELSAVVVAGTTEIQVAA